MGRFTRNYSIGLGVLAAAILALWLANLSPGASALDDLLQRDPQLSAYPYRFRVLSLDDGTATLSTPRSSQVPALRFLAIIDPHLANLPASDPAVIAAQKDLAKYQARARQLVLAQPDVTDVRWRIDTAWYTEHGVMLP